MKRFTCLLFSVYFSFAACAADSEPKGNEKPQRPGSNEQDAATTKPGTSGGPVGGDAGGRATPVLPDAGIPITFVGKGVACGEAKCQDLEVGGEFELTVAGCCADKNASACGLDLEGIGLLLGLEKAGCEPLNLPGSDDATCDPSKPVPVLLPGSPPEGLLFEPCCQENGECGYDANIGGIGFGCVAPERFGRESSGACKFISAQ